MERIFELSLDMISVVGFDGRFKAVNPAFERTLGYAQDGDARPAVHGLRPPGRPGGHAHAFADVVGGGEMNEFENRYICADGSERWLQWSARAVPEQGVVYAPRET